MGCVTENSSPCFRLGAEAGRKEDRAEHDRLALESSNLFSRKRSAACHKLAEMSGKSRCFKKTDNSAVRNLLA